MLIPIGQPVMMFLKLLNASVDGILMLETVQIVLLSLVERFKLAAVPLSTLHALLLIWLLLIHALCVQPTMLPGISANKISMLLHAIVDIISVQVLVPLAQPSMLVA